jgi:hypothetical protein
MMQPGPDVKIRFRRSLQPYAMGEVRAFPQERAQLFVDDGAAEFVKEDPPQTKVPPIPQEPEAAAAGKAVTGPPADTMTRPSGVVKKG